MQSSKHKTGLLEGKVILVVGGTSGIGEATAIEAAKQGAKVVIAGRRQELGQKLAQRIAGEGGIATFVKMDATKEEEVKHLVQKVVELYGRLDGAFNNVGIVGDGFATIDQFSLASYQKLIDANLTSVVLGLKYQIIQMKKQAEVDKSFVGSIVNNSSIAGALPAAYFGTYSALKSALDSFTKVAAIENGSVPIRVNSVLPGPVDTEILRPVTGKSSQESEASFIATTLLKRQGKPEEIAKPVAFLLSDSASYITGVTLPVDGGWLLGGK